MIVYKKTKHTRNEKHRSITIILLKNERMLFVMNFGKTTIPQKKPGGKMPAT